MDQPLVQLTERFWYLPAHPDAYQTQPLVGVVVGDEETVLLDAGNTPRHAEYLAEALQKLGAPPVGKIIYSHHHWDHVFGACVFDAEVIAHESCEKLLHMEAQKPWSRAYLENRYANDSAYRRIADILLQGIRDWSSFQVVIPQQTFKDKLLVEGAGYALQLEFVGGKHAADSIVIHILNERVMFLGDSFYPPPARLNLSDQDPDLAMLQHLAAQGCEHYLHGHGQPMRRDVLLKWLEMELA